MPGNIYVGDDIVAIYSRLSNSSTFSQKYGLLTLDTFKSILRFEEGILARKEWSEICLQNYT